MVKKLTKASKEAEEIGSSKELYNFLYEACNILRGIVSQNVFKECFYCLGNGYNDCDECNGTDIVKVECNRCREYDKLKLICEDCDVEGKIEK